MGLGPRGRKSPHFIIDTFVPAPYVGGAQGLDSNVAQWRDMPGDVAVIIQGIGLDVAVPVL